MREHNESRLPVVARGGILATVLATGLLVGACGPDVLRDIDGRPIEDPALLARMEDGWLAVDTSGAEICAVLELEIETTYRELRVSDVGALGLKFGTSEPVQSALMHLTEPECSATLSPRLACRGIDDKRRCEAMGGAPEEMCRYVLRAQFFLADLPSRSDHVVLLIGSARQQLAWRP